jgi:hypothetical protein
MVFNEKDKYFFSIVLKQGETFEDVIKRSYAYDINLEDALTNNTPKVETFNKDTGKKESFEYIPYGKYDEDTQTFTWFNNIQNEILQDMIERGIIGDFFKDASTIQKLLTTPEIKISKEYQYVIPYFLAILFSSENIIRFESSDSKNKMYIGIPLEIPDNFNLELFKDDLEKYYDFGKQKRNAKTRKARKGPKK